MEGGGTGDTLQKKSILEGGDTAHTFLMEGTIRVGTPHNIERKTISKLRLKYDLPRLKSPVGGGTPHILS